MGNKRNYLSAIRSEYKEHRSSFVVFSILRLSIILILIHQILTQNYESTYLYIITLILLFVPSIIQVQFRVEIPPLLEIFIFLFIYAAEILGTINQFYEVIPFWDTMLHTFNGFLAAAIGFSLVYLMNGDRKHKISLTPLYMCLVAFCFSMTIGVIWEFMEYGMDHLFGMDHQRDTIIHEIYSRELDADIFGEKQGITNITEVTINGQSIGVDGYIDIGLIDTMKDLFVNLIGAVVFSILGYFYAKYTRNKGIDSILPRLKEEAEDYLDPINRIKAKTKKLIK